MVSGRAVLVAPAFRWLFAVNVAATAGRSSLAPANDGQRGRTQRARPSPNRSTAHCSRDPRFSFRHSPLATGPIDRSRNTTKSLATYWK